MLYVLVTISNTILYFLICRSVKIAQKHQVNYYSIALSCNTSTHDKCGIGTGGLRTLTVEELKERTKVTDSQLDGQIDEKDMLGLSDHFGNVEDYMIPLGLTQSQQRDVTNLLSVKRSTQSAVAEALRLWRKRNPFAATYRALIEIVLNANEGQLAIDICQHLCSLDST